MIRRRPPAAGEGSADGAPAKRERARPDAYTQAVKLLGQRAHFRDELARKLQQRGYGGEEIAAALAKLAEQRYLDDEATARALVEERVRRGDGRLKIQSDLQKRGARGAVATAAMTVAGEDTQRARDAADAWIRRTSERRRTSPALARHLTSRGFAPGLVRKVLSEVGLPFEIDGEDD